MPNQCKSMRIAKTVRFKTAELARCLVYLFKLLRLRQALTLVEVNFLTFLYSGFCFKPLRNQDNNLLRS
jgi:hypothetical protein